MKRRWKKALVIAVTAAVAGSGMPFAGTVRAAENTEQNIAAGEALLSEEAEEEQAETAERPATDAVGETMILEETEAEAPESGAAEPESPEEESPDRIRIAVNGIPEYAAGEEEPALTLPVSVDADRKNAAAGDTVTVTAEDVDGYYLAQIRIGYDQDAGTDQEPADEENTWQTLEVSGNRASFTMPEGSVTVYGDYISVVWDGTIDLTWYDPAQTSYSISYAAQLAGAAALANGLFNDFPLREETDGEDTILYPDVVDADGNPVLGIDDAETVKEGEEEVPVTGYVHAAGSGYEVFADNDGDGLDTAVAGDLTKIGIQRYTGTTGGNNKVTTAISWLGSEDYLDKQVILTDDLDMGGVCADGASRMLPERWTGPNYMPVGGQYSMNPENGYTRLSSYFQGSFDGKGHMVDNIRVARHVSSGNFGNCQSVGLFGVIGHPNRDKGEAKPVVQNVATDGIIYGNRSIGGIVGKNGNSKGSVIRNCINFATIYNTDAKGCGGIAGAGWENLTVENCVNFGLVCTGYNKNAGGLIGSSEALVFDSYTLGYAAGEGKGNENAGQALGTNNGGAVWYNCYALKGGGSGTRNEPGTATETVYGATFGSAIRVLDQASDFRTEAFLSMLNGKVKNNGADRNGYMTSDDAVTPNTKRNWVRGAEQAGEAQFVSGHLSAALADVAAWHDPETEITDKSLQGIANALTAADATGMPVPRTFVHDTSSITGLVTTGTPSLSYYAGETFDTGDHGNQSEGPADPDADAEFSVWATFDDDTWQEIEDYEVIYPNGGDAFTAADTSVTIRVTFLGKTIERTFPVEVTDCELLSFQVSQLPKNVFYARGETFDPNGLILTADYGIAAAGAGEKDEIILTIMVQYEDNRIVLTRKRRSSQIGDQEISFEESELSGEAANAYTFIMSPDGELSADVSRIRVTHSFNGKTLEDVIPVTVMDSEAPRLVKDSDERTVYIASENDFLWFENQISANIYPEMNAVLEEDITIQNPAFWPVGARSSRTHVIYQGIFDGGGHQIDVTIAQNGLAGLFFDLGEQAEVKDLILSGSVSGRSYTGGIAAYLDGGTIRGCTNKASITGSGSRTGGIVGSIRGAGSRIDGCSNTGAVSGTEMVGGIAGTAGSAADIRITGCHNSGTGSVTGTGDQIGGIAGLFNSDKSGDLPAGGIFGCSNAAEVKRNAAGSQTAEYAIGGIAGVFQSGVLTGCKNTGSIASAYRAAAGGIVGKTTAGSRISADYNTGTIAVTAPAITASQGGIGGIAGRTVKGTAISGCYTTGVPQTDDPACAYVAAVIGNAKETASVKGNYALAGTAQQTIRTGGETGDAQAAFLSETDLAGAAALLNESLPDDGSEDAYSYLDHCGGYPVLSWEEAKPHTPGEAVTENETQTQYDSVTYCTECGRELSRETIVKMRFSDVSDPALFYYDAVYWAAGKGITTGFADGTFKPLNNCNRAAVVTFLWRLAGRPEPSAMAAFSDMTGNSDFDKAISWAAEEGITTGWAEKDGTSTFRPWNTCNRAAIVTFLWRYAGRPEPDAIADFTDMPADTKANQDFRKAISWAAETGITTGWDEKDGTSTFRPWNECKRLAIVSFLYRYAEQTSE